MTTQEIQRVQTQLQIPGVATEVARQVRIARLMRQQANDRAIADCLGKIATACRLGRPLEQADKTDLARALNECGYSMGIWV